MIKYNPKKKLTVFLESFSMKMDLIKMDSTEKGLIERDFTEKDLMNADIIAIKD